MAPRSIQPSSALLENSMGRGAWRATGYSTHTHTHTHTDTHTQSPRFLLEKWQTEFHEKEEQQMIHTGNVPSVLYIVNNSFYVE